MVLNFFQEIPISDCDGNHILHPRGVVDQNSERLCYRLLVRRVPIYVSGKKVDDAVNQIALTMFRPHYQAQELPSRRPPRVVVCKAVNQSGVVAEPGGMDGQDAVPSFQVDSTARPLHPYV